MDINGKVALVTGGSRRLGREIALELGRRGARVAVHYHASAAPAERTVAEIAAGGSEAFAVAGDLRDPAAVERVVAAAAERWGGLDVLVNSAASFLERHLLHTSAAEWDDVMALNLRAPFLAIRAAATAMRARGGGCVINIGDLAGQRGWPAFAAHSVSKSALEALTRVAARELAPLIRVNCVVPGTVLPPEHMDAAAVDALVARTPARRIGSPGDVARAVCYLIEADYVTGESLIVDGGRHLV